MNLVPVEWAEAQDILLKLVQMLTPWAGREISPSFFLSRRFSFSFMDREERPSIRSPVQLLTTLRTAREFVEEWVGETEPAAAESRPKEEPAPFTKQAQRMIDEVQEAIGSMVYSANLKRPQEEPLRLALKRLKPHLDELIEAVASEGMHSSDERPAPFRFAVPVSSREHLLKRIAQRGEAQGWEVEKRGGEIEEKLSPGRSPSSMKESLRGGERVARGLRREEAISEKGARPTPQPEKGALPSPTEGGDSVHLPSNERTSLPAVPFIAQLKNALAPNRKKKKRKGFWFRDDESDRDDR